MFERILHMVLTSVDIQQKVLLFFIHLRSQPHERERSINDEMWSVISQKHQMRLTQ